MKKLRISTIICVIFSVFAVWVTYMLMLPAINLRAASFYWFVALVSIIITAIFGIRDFFGDVFAVFSARNHDRPLCL